MTVVADGEDDGDRTRELLDVARELGDGAGGRRRGRDHGAAGGGARQIRAGSGETITPADLLEALRARSGWDWVKSTRRLAGLLNPLGITRRQLWNGERRRWCYLLDAEQLGDLRPGTARVPSRRGPGGAPMAVVPRRPQAVKTGETVKRRI